MLRFIKNWTLPISMIIGVIAYFVFIALPLPIALRTMCVDSLGIIQPMLLAMMLFVSFCKVSPTDLKPRRWHALLLAIQMLFFLMLSGLAYWFHEDEGLEILFEGAMLCLMCPTATAAAVVTSKLGGSPGSIVTYTLFINIAISLSVPIVLPVVHPQIGMDFLSALLMILLHVFPLLVGPLLVAWLVRYLLPRLHKAILSLPDLAFYLWAISLALAITVSTKSLMHSTVSIWYEIGLSLISLVACALQFFLGKRIGGEYGERICGGQAFGQKNTVFLIWLGYTFLNPVTSVVGGFYSIWHNVVNSYQLWRMRTKG